jgi:hypothetical protein
MNVEPVQFSSKIVLFFILIHLHVFEQSKWIKKQSGKYSEMQIRGMKEIDGWGQNQPSLDRSEAKPIVEKDNNLVLRYFEHPKTTRRMGIGKKTEINRKEPVAFSFDRLRKEWRVSLMA